MAQYSSFRGIAATIYGMWRKMLVISILIGAFATPRGSTTQGTNSPSFSISVNLVKVPISIFDERGSLVGDLRREDFRIWEDQVLQEIRSFGVDTNPVSVVLALDTSTSEKSELKKIKEAAEEFAGALSREDRISLITFDDEVRCELDWTNNQKLLRKTLGKIHTGLRTALYDAMYLAACDQLKGVDGRKAIILLTDCLNNQSRVDFKDASLAIAQSQASLYVVSKTVMAREEAKHERRVVMLTDIYKRLFGKDDDYIDEFFKKREAEMTALAEETGGRCFFPTDYDHIKSVYSEVAREIKSKYFLTYISNQQMPPDSFHRISIEYLAPATKIQYRKSYYYQPQPVRLKVPPPYAMH
jgi:Ca-activated chloride channel homolog